jgi:hypothetical protein
MQLSLGPHRTQDHSPAGVEVNVVVQFVFPGEGMIIDGIPIAPDTSLAGDEALDQLSGYKELRKRIRESKSDTVQP